MILVFLREIIDWLSQRTGAQVDQINFVCCMLLNLPLGLFYRVILHPKKVSRTVRLATGLAWGLAITWFCFGSQLINVLAAVILCYTLTRFADPTVVHRYVFVAAFGSLSAAQIHRILVDYGNNSVDYILVLMLMTQKFTYAAFSVHDGRGRDQKTLSEEQKHQQLKQVPSVLEYSAYVFHYSMLLAGPTITFRDYMDFIEGKDMDLNQNKTKTKDSSGSEPSPMRAVMAKLAESILYVTLFLSLGGPNGVFAILRNTEPEFAARHSFLWRVVYSHISIVVYRLRYYIAWSLSEFIITYITILSRYFASLNNIMGIEGEEGRVRGNFWYQWLFYLTLPQIAFEPRGVYSRFPSAEMKVCSKYCRSHFYIHEEQ